MNKLVMATNDRHPMRDFISDPFVISNASRHKMAPGLRYRLYAPNPPRMDLVPSGVAAPKVPAVEPGFPSACPLP